MTAPTLRRQPLRLLLVCTDRDERDRLSAALARGPDDLACAGALDEALACLRTSPIDVAIVCDRTGAFDAFAGARALREQAPALQTLLLADGAGERQLRAALDAGAAGCLGRPASPEALAQALERIGALAPGRRDAAVHRASLLDADPRHGVLEVDREGRISFANAAARALLPLGDSPDGGGFAAAIARGLADHRGCRASGLTAAVAAGLSWRGELAGAAAGSVYDCEVLPDRGLLGAPGCRVFLRDVSGLASERDELAFQRGVAEDALLLLSPGRPGPAAGAAVEEPPYGFAEVVERAFARCGMTPPQLAVAPAVPSACAGGRARMEELFAGLAMHLRGLKGLRGLSLEVSLAERTPSAARLSCALRARSAAIDLNGYQRAGDYAASLGGGDASGLGPRGIFLAAARVAESGGELVVKRFAGEEVAFSFGLVVRSAGAAAALAGQPDPAIRPSGAMVWTSRLVAQRAASWRILVADDNRADQMAIQALLARCGQRDVVVAGNGREAVEELEQGGFDLVFMDILMPVLNGFEATRVLRQRERLAGVSTPVVALTSYSLKAVHEECLAAGMDGYLSKPINAEALSWTLARLAAGAPPAPAPGTPPPAPSAPLELPVLDLAGVMESYGGDAVLCRSLAEVFSVETAPVVIRLEQALAAGELAAAGPAAHKLKGTTSAIGGLRLSELLRSIDEGVRRGDRLDPKALRLQVVAEYGALKEAVEAIDWGAVAAPAAAG